jgi:hypothetical protein
MGYARSLGQTVSVRQRDLANTHGVCGRVAHIQSGVLGEGFRPVPSTDRLACRDPIGDHLDPVMHLRVNLPRHPQRLACSRQ